MIDYHNKRVFVLRQQCIQSLGLSIIDQSINQEEFECSRTVLIVHFEIDVMLTVVPGISL